MAFGARSAAAPVVMGDRCFETTRGKSGHLAGRPHERLTSHELRGSTAAANTCELTALPQGRWR
jgi:dihydrofolate reductase